MKQTSKKEWTTPQLTVHGNVKQITQQPPTWKTLGAADGVMVSGQPAGDSAS
jgi:hypothetical protein